MHNQKGDPFGEILYSKFWLVFQFSPYYLCYKNYLYFHILYIFSQSIILKIYLIVNEIIRLLRSRNIKL